MENTLTVDTTKSDRKASSALTWARELSISTPEEYAQADALCKGLYDLRKEIEGDFAESRAKAKEAKRAATDALAAIVEQEESHTKPVLEAEKIAKGKLLTFRQEEERRRQEAQEKAQAEARKKAEDEQLRKAAALEANGNKAKAEEVLNKPTKVATVIIPPSLPKAATTIRTVKKYRVLSQDGVKREFCAPDPGKMWKAVQLYGKKAEEIVGGIEVWEEPS